MNASMDLFVLWTALLLGLRHSLDFDHLAAIADIAGAQSTRKGSFRGCLGYALGHAGIVMVLGGAALLLGLHIPEAFGAVMGKLVGATLLLLAGAIIVSALKFRDQGKIVSRFRIIYTLANRLLFLWKGKRGADKADTDDLSFAGCSVIGVLHGIGVESPWPLLCWLYTGSRVPDNGRSCS
jgi:high-affinity nickel-transport protein